ncbi:hypothetical protein [Hellea balneolensis]|uniref:hypothetical protein n=1 Tax=Hellea balneolensis TaxID=287478 RepID=UPI000429559E|nr:hypothetical protein [Hellea balneolensis]
MRIKFKILAAISSLSLAAFASPALAGGCMNGAPNCNMGVKVIPSSPAQFGPMTVHTAHPMGHLRQVDFQRAPNVSITRVHGMGPTASLSDAPSGFTNGCFPTSTNYCRSDVGTPVSVEMAPQPVIAQPVVAQPYVAPAPQPMRTVIGQGYDASKFAPRQYGDNTFTPGIVHAPTSYVDRSPNNAQAALNSGRAVAQPLANGGMTPAYGMTTPLQAAPMQQRVVTLPGTMAPNVGVGMGMRMAPAMPMARPVAMGRQATAPVLTQNGTYASNVGTDGSYWEKVSGPTMFGNTMATQVICKRKLPTQVVNPVVNVPYAVPTPVPTCGPATGGAHPHQGHQHPNYALYGHPQGRWTQ